MLRATSPPRGSSVPEGLSHQGLGWTGTRGLPGKSKQVEKEGVTESSCRAEQGPGDWGQR